MRTISPGCIVMVLVSASVLPAQNDPPPDPNPPASNAQPALGAPSDYDSSAGEDSAALTAQELPKLLDDVRQEISNRESLSGVSVTDGNIVQRALAPGMDVRFAADGGTLAQRVELHRTVKELMQKNEIWREWLDSHGFLITYARPPVGAEYLTQTKPTATELAAISALLSMVLDQTELDTSLQGAYVQSAVLADPLEGPGRVLRIRGRLAAESQRSLLRHDFDEAFLALNGGRPQNGEIYLSLQDMTVAPPNRPRSYSYFSIGLSAFWDCDLITAQQAFTRAIADDPTSPVLRYWQVVTHLALGQEDRARPKLEQLLHSNPQGSREDRIADSLERVQGPLRWQLSHLEEEVLLTLLP